MEFVEFTGEETEKEFLQKVLKKWDLTADSDKPDMFKMMELGTVFSEIRHRIAELD